MSASREIRSVHDDDDELAWRRLETTPLLGMLAAVAALADLAINRVALRTLGGTLTHDELLVLSQWGHLPRNLAAIAGLVALTLALLAVLRTPMHAPVRRRLSIAGFAGIFLPTTALATLLPAERTSDQIVLFAVGAANVLAVLLGLTAARRPAPWGIRAGTALISVSAFFAFVALLVSVVEPLAHTAFGLAANAVLRRIGEVCFLIAPIAIGASLSTRRPRTTRDKVALAVGIVTFLVAACVGWWGLDELASDFGIVLYGAARVELFLESAPFLYVVVLAAALGIGARAVVASDPALRQAGTGLLLLVAGGYAARSPGRLLMTVLAIALIARSCIVLGERLVLLRAEQRRAREHATVPVPSPEPEREAPAES